MLAALHAPLRWKGSIAITPLKSLLYGSLTLIAVAGVIAGFAAHLFILAYKLPLSIPAIPYLASYIRISASGLVASSLGFAVIATVGLDLFFKERKRAVIQAPNLQFKEPSIIVPGSC